MVDESRARPLTSTFDNVKFVAAPTMLLPLKQMMAYD
jgi:hypothetical protein